MHLNYHFFKFLCPQLTEIYSRKKIIQCFSQSKGELLIEIEDAPWLRLFLKPPTVVLSFPDGFHRAKQNTRDIFRDILQVRIQRFEELNFDRSFLMILENGSQLLFKMHGNRSNVIFYPNQQTQPSELLLPNLEADKTIVPSDLEKNLDLSFGEFELLDGNASKFLPSLGAIPRSWLKQRNYPELSLLEKWGLMQTLIDHLASPLYHIVEQKNGYDISLLPEEKFEKQVDNPINACNELNYFEVIKSGFERQKNQLLKGNTDEIKKTISYLNKAKSKLNELQASPPPSQLADVIMANLHLFERGSAKLFDFYANAEVKVELKHNQKPQEYAEKLYKKSKNRKLEWGQLQKNITQKEIQLENLEALLEEINEIENARDLKKFVKRNETISAQKVGESSVPFKIFEVDGYPIWVGKSAKANDEMLRNHTKKNDYWLHARNVAGSHVLIKTGKLVQPPVKVLEVAASLAAYYSKSKTQSLAPVIYTQAKYVRKVKGSPTGQVVVDKESVLMIEPKGPEQIFDTKS